MAKLTKKQKHDVRRILWELDRAITFIKSDRVKLCVKSRGSTTIEYVNPEGEYITSVCKEIGQDLTGLYNGRISLQKFLDSHTDKA